MGVELRVFKSNIQSVKYIFKNGTAANFQHGIYRTDKPQEIYELEEEANSGHPHIFIDENEKVVYSDALDPMHNLRAKIIEEYLAQQRAATDPTRQLGEYTPPSIKPSSTQEISTADLNASNASTAQPVLQAPAVKISTIAVPKK